MEFPGLPNERRGNWLLDFITRSITELCLGVYKIQGLCKKTFKKELSWATAVSFIWTHFRHKLTYIHLLKETLILASCRCKYGYWQEIGQGKGRSQSHLHADCGFGLSDRFVFCKSFYTVKFQLCGVELHCLIINNLSWSLISVVLSLVNMVLPNLVFIVNKLNLYIVAIYCRGYRNTYECCKRQTKYCTQPPIPSISNYLVINSLLFYVKV